MRGWTEDPAGIFGATSVDINVGGTTSVIGGAIVSETEGGLSLVTGDLVVEDIAINDNAQDTYTDVQVNVDVEGIVTGKTDGDIFNSNSYGSIEHSDVGHDKEGVIKGTISGGSVTVGGTRDDEGNIQGGEVLDVAALEEMGINTDVDNIVTITKDESWEESFKVDLINVGVVAEQVDNLVNVVQSFTAKVPDHVKAQGKAAEDIYRKAIANGMEKDNLEAFANSAEFAQVASLRARIEQEYENGTISAEYIYTQLHNEVLAFANDYVVQNCSSGTEICDSILRAMGTNGEELTSGAIVDLMLAIEGLYKSGGEGFALEGVVDETGAQIIGDSLMQTAINCSVLWINDTREREGDVAADEQLKQNIQDPKYQEFLENSGIDPAQYLIDTQFDIKFETDQETHDKVNTIMQINSKHQQANEFVKMLAKFDGNGNPIVQNGKYVIDDEKDKNLLQSMLELGNNQDINADTWEALSAARYMVGVKPDTYQEYEIIGNLLKSGIDLDLEDDSLNSTVLEFEKHFGDLMLDVNIRFATIPSNGKSVTGGYTSSNFMAQQDLVKLDDGSYVLGDYDLVPSEKIINGQVETGVPEHKIVINKAFEGKDSAHNILLHELTHNYQYQNVYNLVNYGRDSKGNLVADDCLNQSTCRGTLWQYVNFKANKSKNYTSNKVSVIKPNSKYSLPVSVYFNSPIEVLPHSFHGYGNRFNPNLPTHVPVK